MKKCFRCGIKKSIKEFYTHPETSDGHLGKCKQCCCIESRANREKRKDYYVEYERHRFGESRRKEQVLESQRRRRIVFPNKHKAYTAVRAAIRNGNLTRQPCEICATTVKIEAHYDNYDRPLDVRWLCFKHHREVHGQKVY